MSQKVQADWWWRTISWLARKERDATTSSSLISVFSVFIVGPLNQQRHLGMALVHKVLRGGQVLGGFSEKSPALFLHPTRMPSR